MYSEDRRLRISKNGVLRKLFGTDREGKRKLEGCIVRVGIVICIPQLRRGGCGM